MCISLCRLGSTFRVYLVGLFAVTLPTVNFQLVQKYRSVIDLFLTYDKRQLKLLFVLYRQPLLMKPAGYIQVLIGGSKLMGLM